jgi:SAM-dependent methyltransferase
MRWDEWRDFIQEIGIIEQYWRHQPITIEADHPGQCQGWLPYPIPQFITYLCDAVSVIPGPQFLDVGCGPGTKIRIAQELFGLTGAGLELAPEMVQAAAGVLVHNADARTWDRYAEADIVYMNRPIVPSYPFEQHVMAAMKPRAVLMSVNGTTLPSDQGWIPVAEEIGPGPVCGVWVKPLED